MPSTRQKLQVGYTERITLYITHIKCIYDFESAPKINRIIARKIETVVVEGWIENSFSKDDTCILSCPTSACTATSERRRASRGGRTAANSCSLVEDGDADATQLNLTVPRYRTTRCRCSRVTCVLIDRYTRRKTRVVRLLGDLRCIYICIYMIYMYIQLVQLIEINGSTYNSFVSRTRGGINRWHQRIFLMLFLVRAARDKFFFSSVFECVFLRDFSLNLRELASRVSASSERVMGQNWF